MATGERPTINKSLTEIRKEKMTGIYICITYCSFLLF